MFPNRVSTVVFIFTLVVPVLSFAKLTHFDMKDLGQRNLLLVSSEAVFDRTVAMTHYLSGSIDLDPELITEIKGEFEVDVRTLETGTELKNLQIKDQLLGTQEFPTITGTMNSNLANLKLKLLDGKPINVRVEAMVKIKNVSKAIPMNLKLTYFKENEQTRQRLTGNLLKVAASAEIELGAFGIIIPNGYTGTLSKFAQVTLDALGSDRLPAENLPLPEGIKKK